MPPNEGPKPPQPEAAAAPETPQRSPDEFRVSLEVFSRLMEKAKGNLPAEAFLMDNAGVLSEPPPTWRREFTSPDRRDVSDKNYRYVLQQPVTPATPEPQAAETAPPIPAAPQTPASSPPTPGPRVI